MVLLEHIMRPLLCLITLLTALGCTTAKPGEPTRIIDTHIHLYDTARPQGVPWPGKNDTILYKPHLPADFRKVAAANGVTHAIVVEASEWVWDNQWLLDVTKDDELFIAVVGNLLPGGPVFPGQLGGFANDKRFVGIRPRVPQALKLTDDACLGDLAKLAEKNLSLDLLTHTATLDDIAVIAAKLPTLRIIVNHLAGARVDGETPDAKWLAQIQNLAKHPNVYCKISGLSQQSTKKPAPMELAFYTPTLEALWSAFGEDRLIFASNWPVSEMGGQYAGELRMTKEFIATKGAEATEKLFWKNAMRAYGLK
jgi:L-fuconolactonase